MNISKSSTIVMIAMMIVSNFTVTAQGADGPPGQAPSPRSVHRNAFDKHNCSLQWQFEDANDVLLTNTILGRNGTCLAGNAGTWAIPVSAPKQEFHHSAVWDPKDRIMLVFGGYSSNRTMAYDPSSGNWTDRTPKVDWWEYSAVWDPVHEQALIFGGEAGTSPNNMLWAYCPANDTWTEKARGPLRSGHAAVWDDVGNRMLVFGGYDEAFPGSYPSDVWAYDPSTDRWAQIAPELSGPSGRADVVAVWDDHNHKMLIMGGANVTTDKIQDDIWGFDPSCGTWAQKKTSPGPRVHHTAVWDGKHLEMIVFGGQTESDYAGETWAYHPMNDSWTHKTTSTRPVAYHSAVWDDQNDRMLVYGGWSSLFGSDLVQSLHVGFLPEGEVRSKPVDLSLDLHSIDRLEFNFSDVPRTAIGVEVRVSPDKSKWSDWTGVANGSGPSVKDRFIEWRATLSSYDTARSPQLIDLSIFYTLNKRPCANAVSAVRAYRKVPVPLNGSATDADGDGLTFFWRRSGGPAVEILDPASLNASFIAAEPGNYSFVLGASDGFDEGLSGPAHITVLNRVPVASAGPDQTVPPVRPISLNGSGTDGDADALTFCWTQTAGNPVVLQNSTGPSPSFITYELGFFIFSLVVSDGYDRSEPSAVRIIVANQHPSGTMDPDLSAFRNRTITLGCNATDPDNDTLVCSWRPVSGPKATLDDAATFHPRFIPKYVGSYKFEANVSDQVGGNWSGTQSVEVLNQGPVPYAGPDQAAEVNATVRLTGTAQDADGDALAFRWTQLSGFQVHISDSQTPDASFLALFPDRYVFRLTVSDGFDEASSTTNVTVDKPNVPPRFSTSPPPTAQVGKLYSYTAYPADDDLGDALNLTLFSVPEGMWLVGRIVQWTPVRSQAGEQKVSLALSDGKDTVFQNWTITVSPAPAPATASGPGFPPWIIAAVVVVAATAACAGLLLRRQRKAPPSGPTPPGPPGA